jgi:hypothetical protein
MASLRQRLLDPSLHALDGATPYDELVYKRGDGCPQKRPHPEDPLQHIQKDEVRDMQQRTLALINLVSSSLAIQLDRSDSGPV